MDRRRMDAEGDRMVHRRKRARKLARKLAVVVVLQNLLVASCLLVTFYVYWNVEKPISEDNVHIQFMTIAGISSNGTLKFGNIRRSNGMSLVGKQNDRIQVNCTGPYVLYMDVCYKSLREYETRGSLQLQVVGSKTPVWSVNLTTLHEVCRGLHSIAYLRAMEEASLYLYVTDGFKVKNVTVGLSHLLGSRCDY